MVKLTQLITALVVFFGMTVFSAYAADINVGRDKIVGDASTGLQFDANADGTSDVVFSPDGSIQSKNTNERIVGQYGEYIDFNDEGDGTICVGGQRGTRETNLCVKFDEDETRLYSPEDNSILIAENLKVWLKEGEPTYLTVQSNGSQDAKVLFNEDAYTRGEIFSHGKTNSFRINSQHSSGLYLNGDTKFNISAVSGGGKMAVGHDKPVTELDLQGALTMRQTSEPPNPPEGSMVMWVDKNGAVMVKITSGGRTKSSPLFK